MNLSVFSSGALIFFGCMCLHIIVWRWRNPKSYLAALVLIFAGVPFAGIVAGGGLYWGAGFSPIGLSLSDWVAVLLMHLSLSAAYILTYPAMQASCPSLKMLLIIGASMPRGSTHEELKAPFAVENLLIPRIKDLVDARFARESDGYYSITRRGLVVLTPFMLLRRMLGLPRGKG